MENDESCCPICEKTAPLKSQEQYGYQSTKKYAIYHCDHCSTAFASPLKVDESIYNCIYSKAREVPGYDRYYDYAEKVLEVPSPLDYLANAEDVYWGIRQFLNSKTRSLRILEVGCGFGYLTYAIKKAGHDIKGIDISKVAVEKAAERYGDLFSCIDVREMAQSEGPSYDLIIFTEVIEHIDNVKEFMRAVNKLLIPGGHLLVTTPNKTPYPQDVLWETEPPPVHLLWLSENSMRHLAKEMNHRVDFIDFQPLNRKEFLELGCYFSPTTSIRDYTPTRLPRLDEKGNVMKEMPTSVHALPEFLDRLQPPLQKKSFLERAVCKIARSVPQMKKIQLQLEAYFKRKEFQKKLEAIPHTRPTMCAIFTKV
ncbi:Methyltransferase type 11 [Chlamydiales bacterium STE3]|nr:Methyltransferase type 11 [Chlamydiales bacterium STE3]